MESNEALRKSNEDLNQFAYAASHDLQEPLRLVALYSQILQRKYIDKLDPQADQYISYVISGAHRMETLLRDLLDYSQVGSSPGEEPAGPVVCSEALRKAYSTALEAIRQSLTEVVAEAIRGIDQRLSKVTDVEVVAATVQHQVLRSLSTGLDPATRFYGYDISPSAFAICSQKSSERLTYRLANLLRRAIVP